MLSKQDPAVMVSDLRQAAVGEPGLATSQWSLLAQSPHGNLLCDPHVYADDEAVSARLGGVAVIATSHPHMFAAQVGWSDAFGRVSLQSS